MASPVPVFIFVLKKNPTRWRAWAFAVWLLLTAWGLPSSQALAADWKHAIDFTKLESVLGGSVPNGAGVPISLVEAGGVGGNYFPDTDNSEFNAAGDPFGVEVNFFDGSSGRGF